MASITFGSIGDLIAITGILINAAQALSESKGSVKKYRSLVRELKCLRELLETVKSALKEDVELKYKTRLAEIVNSCERHFNEYSKDIEQFRSSLGEEPSASTLKQVYKKLRWLSRTDDVAAFHNSVSLYTSEIAGILALSGIDLMLKCHNLTKKQIATGLAELQDNVHDLHANQTANQTANHAQFQAALSIQSRALGQIRRNRVDLRRDQMTLRRKVLTAIEHNGQSLMSHNQLHASQTNEQLELLCARFDRLEATNVALQNRRSRGYLDTSDQRLIEANKTLVRAILIAILQFSKSSLTSAMAALHVLHYFLFGASIPAAPKPRCMLFQDAILRQFSIDIDFMSYHSFCQLIEDNFRDTPGAGIVEGHHYIFEDAQHNEVSLSTLWQARALCEKTIFMRVFLLWSRGACFACGLAMPLYNSRKKEVQCECGVFISTQSKALETRKRRRLPPIGWSPSSALRMLPSDGTVIDQPDRPNLQAAAFFKRVQRVYSPYAIERERNHRRLLRGVGVRPAKAQSWHRYIITGLEQSRANHRRENNMFLRHKKLQRTVA